MGPNQITLSMSPLRRFGAGNGIGTESGGHGDLEVTLNFKTHDDNCLYGKLREWQDDETLLDVIWPRGHIHKCKVVDLSGGIIDTALTLFNFSVTIREFN